METVKIQGKDKQGKFRTVYLSKDEFKNLSNEVPGKQEKPDSGTDVAMFILGSILGACIFYLVSH